MPLLKRIKDLFKKEEPERISIEKATELIKTNTKQKENEALENTYEKSTEIMSSIQDLKQMLEEFNKKEIKEERAAASKSVKDIFCSSSIKELSSINSPQKSLKDIEDFLNNTENILNSLGSLTPKRTMHIRFFFPDDFKAVSKKATDINNTVKETRELLSPIKEFRRYEELEKDITYLETEKEKSSKEKESIEKNNQELEKRINETKTRIKEIDDEFSKLTPLRNDLEENKTKLKLVEQEMNSYLSVEKLLKKYQHEKETKDQLINDYIQSPSKAILNDSELRILTIIEDAMKIAIDDKKLEKAENIVKNKEYLNEKRNTMLSLIENIENKEKQLENQSRPIIEKASKLRNEETRLEKEKEQLVKLLENANHGIEAIEKERKLRIERLNELTKELSPNPIEQTGFKTFSLYYKDILS